MTSVSLASAVGAALPHNIEAEQQLLGAILINNQALDRVSAFLGAGHFYDPLHARIFDVASQMIAAGRLANPVTLKHAFGNAEPISDGMTVPQYLGRLAASATTIINAADYGRTVRDLATRRALVSIGEEMVSAALDTNADVPVERQLEEAEAQLHDIAEKGVGERVESNLMEAMHKAIRATNAAYMRGTGLVGLSTGIPSLDAKLGGLAASDLAVLAGRPAMGKSALGANIALNVAKAGIPTAFYSLEMSDEQIAARLLSSETGISAWGMRTGRLHSSDIERMVGVAQKMTSTPLYFDQSAGLSIAQLAARARRLKRKKKIGLIVVDYLQLMRASGRHNNRVGEITEITTGLKALAKELEVPIIALSQLSRQVEARADKRPVLSDLRESGSIEQDADIVMFCYRDAYYVEAEKPDAHDAASYQAWLDRMSRAHGKAEVIVAKHRHGPTGTVHLSFDKDRATFHEPADDARLPTERYP